MSMSSTVSPGRKVGAHLQDDVATVDAARQAMNGDADIERVLIDQRPLGAVSTAIVRREPPVEIERERRGVEDRTLDERRPVVDEKIRLLDEQSLAHGIGVDVRDTQERNLRIDAPPGFTERLVADFRTSTIRNSRHRKPLHGVEGSHGARSSPPTPQFAKPTARTTLHDDEGEPELRVKLIDEPDVLGALPHQRDDAIHRPSETLGGHDRAALDFAARNPRRERSDRNTSHCASMSRLPHNVKRPRIIIATSFVVSNGR